MSRANIQACMVEQTFGRCLFLQKSLIVGVRLGSKYTSAFYIFLINQSSSFYKSLYFDNRSF